MCIATRAMGSSFHRASRASVRGSRGTEGDIVQIEMELFLVVCLIRRDRGGDEQREDEKEASQHLNHPM